MIGRRNFILTLSGAALAGCQMNAGSGLGGIDLQSALGGAGGLGGLGGLGPLTDGEIGKGLKEALRIGTQRVVGQVGATD